MISAEEIQKVQDLNQQIQTKLVELNAIVEELSEHECATIELGADDPTPKTRFQQAKKGSFWLEVSIHLDVAEIRPSREKVFDTDAIRNFVGDEGDQ